MGIVRILTCFEAQILNLVQPEDLIKFGLIPEFLGRLPVIATLDELAEGKVVVVGGFQGVSYRRDITTLGRGGSDTTAVALAAAIDAERCEIYSDVDGVYSTDPSVVADARHLPVVSYPVMQEMSAAGAKVLRGTCFYNQYAREIGEANGWKRLLSNSTKIVNIISGYGYQPALASMETCIAAAVAGEIQ